MDLPLFLLLLLFLVLLSIVQVTIPDVLHLSPFKCDVSVRHFVHKM